MSIPPRDFLLPPAVLTAILLLCCSLGSHEKRGDSYFEKGRYRDALAEYLIARREKPSSTEILFKVGVAATRTGDMAMATAYYDTLLAIDASRKEWIVRDLFQFGLKSLEEGDVTSMTESFQTILDLDSTHNLGESFYPLARAYRESGQFQRAIRAYLKALSFAPDSPEATDVLFELARCYEEIGRYKEAIAYYEDFIEKQGGPPGHEVLWHLGNTAYLLAEELYSTGNLEEAREYLLMVIDIGQPQVLMIDARYLLGEISYANGEFEQALDEYNEVVKLDPARTMQVTVKSLERIREIRYGTGK